MPVLNEAPRLADVWRNRDIAPRILTLWPILRRRLLVSRSPPPSQQLVVPAEHETGWSPEPA
jgi:hypothetical protein